MKMTFRQYLIELMVDVDTDDPAGTVNATKKALRNPELAAKEELKANIDDQRTVQQNKEDPNSSEKLRIIKMKQQILRNEERMKKKEEAAAKKAGV